MELVNGCGTFVRRLLQQRFIGFGRGGNGFANANGQGQRSRQLAAFGQNAMGAPQTYW